MFGVELPSHPNSYTLRPGWRRVPCPGASGRQWPRRIRAVLLHLTAHRPLGDPVKVQVLILWIWDGARGSTFHTSSQVRRMLLAPGQEFQRQGLASRAQTSWAWNSKFGGRGIMGRIAKWLRRQPTVVILCTSNAFQWDVPLSFSKHPFI